MDYMVRFGLEFNPFLKNSKEILIHTNEYKETLFRLDYLSKTKGFGLLTGSPCKGKTTAVHNWAASLNPSLYKVVYSSFSTLTANDFYRNLVTEFGAQSAFRKPDNFHIIQEKITRLAVEKRYQNMHGYFITITLLCILFDSSFNFIHTKRVIPQYPRNDSSI